MIHNLTTVTSTGLLSLPDILCVLSLMLVITMHSPVTHYGCETGGYKIMVSLGMWFSPINAFLEGKASTAVCVCLFCCCCFFFKVLGLCQRGYWNAKFAITVTPFKSVKLTVVMDIQMWLGPSSEFYVIQNDSGSYLLMALIGSLHATCGF